MSKYNPYIHDRKSIRLRDYDYSSPGYYFATIGTQKKECLFGEVKNDQVILSEIGKTVVDQWLYIPRHFDRVSLDEFIVMPNHVHGIIVIEEPAMCRGWVPQPHLSNFNKEPTSTSRGGGTPPLRRIGLFFDVVAYFKYQTTRYINEMRDSAGIKVWQRGYFERIIRDEEELFNVRNYIIANPVNWKRSEFFEH